MNAHHSHARQSSLALLCRSGILGLLACAPALADTTWPAGSTQTLVLDFLVNDTLTIEPGVTVEIGPGARLLVGANGFLNVLGTPGNPVVFTSIDESRWGGIVFQEGSEGSITDAVVEHAAPFGISIESASPSIAHTTIKDIISASAATPAIGIKVFGSEARPLIESALIESIVGATAAQPATAGAGSNGPNGGNGTFFSPSGGNGGPGGTGGVGATGAVGGAAYGVQMTASAAATVLRTEIRAITGGVGATGANGGKGGSGGSGGDGVSGLTNGHGGNGANGGNGGKGGHGGAGGVAAGMLFSNALDNAMALDGLVITSITGGAGGKGGQGGNGGLGGGGGDGASCVIPGCNGGNGGDGGNGGASGSGGQTGNGGDSYALFVDGTHQTIAHGTLVGLSPGSGLGAPIVTFTPPPPPRGSNCYFDHPGQGCDDAECSAAVCAIDPFCCEVTWDGLCVLEVESICTGGGCQPCYSFDTADPGTAGWLGVGGQGGEAFFPAQDGDYGDDGAPGSAGAEGSFGVVGTSYAAAASNSFVDFVSSVVEMVGNNSPPEGTGEMFAFSATNNGALNVESCCAHGFTQLFSMESGGSVNLIDNVLLNDPEFANADSGDFALASSSPCIDAAGPVPFTRAATAWKALVDGVPAFAFDEFYPGLAPPGCLAQTATIVLPGGTMSASATLDNGSANCAISDGSTGPMVSDGALSGADGARFVLEFDAPIIAFYTYYGSVNVNAKVRMRLFDGEDQVGALTSASSTHFVNAMGHGFVGSRAVDRIEFQSLSDISVIVGAFVGLAAGEQSLDVVNIPGYAGPSGANVQCDFAAGFAAAVVLLDGDENPRIVDGDDDGVAIADMGAYEFQNKVVVPCPSDVNGDGAIDASDLAIVLGAWGPCAGCSADLNDDGAVDASDLAILLGAWGPCL